MTFTDTDILELNGLGVRSDGFLYTLLDRTHRPIGTLNVSEDSPPTITNDTTRTTFRTCTSLLVASSDLSAINPLQDRLAISMQLQNGAIFPLGVFMFGADTRAPYSWGTLFTPEAFDETFILHQQLDRDYPLAPGQSMLAVVNQLVADSGLMNVDLSMVQDAFCPAGAGTHFPIGSYRDAAITTLIHNLGYATPYFSNSGVLTTKPFPTPNSTATLVYESGGRLIDGSIQSVNSIYSAPNRWVVSPTSTTGGAVEGIYDLPSSAPNSYANTGIRTTSVDTSSLVSSATIAAQIAYGNSLTDPNSYVQATFDSTADPRHDTFDLVQILGVTMAETGWSLVCSSGGKMSHSAVAYYSSA